MKKTIYLLAFLTISFINAQTKESDYFTIYKGGEKYLKPLKYILFDEVRNSEFEKKKIKIKFTLTQKEKVSFLI
ncbi:hypothetical protein [Flavobacterium ginsengisoli]|uniref:hypothetical protein n=1 Tax=Flavobacterium ginsengisoli TaxID=871694 RepID=UPI0024157208|nr:hypothetical protein [Flavobacterium ginsengisoli]